jgi:hypothetical protein
MYNHKLDVYDISKDYSVLKVNIKFDVYKFVIKSVKMNAMVIENIIDEIAFSDREPIKIKTIYGTYNLNIDTIYKCEISDINGDVKTKVREDEPCLLNIYIIGDPVKPDINKKEHVSCGKTIKEIIDAVNHKLTDRREG